MYIIHQLKYKIKNKKKQKALIPINANRMFSGKTKFPSLYV
jgi:hypothetical protein